MLSMSNVYDRKSKLLGILCISSEDRLAVKVIGKLLHMQHNFVTDKRLCCLSSSSTQSDDHRTEGQKTRTSIYVMGKMIRDDQ